MTEQPSRPKPTQPGPSVAAAKLMEQVIFEVKKVIVG